MEITPRELRDVEIREAFRGYSRDEVNELLERAAATLDAANERVQQMSERLNTAQSETGHTPRDRRHPPPHAAARAARRRRSGERGRGRRRARWSTTPRSSRAG